MQLILCSIAAQFVLKMKYCVEKFKSLHYAEWKKKSTPNCMVFTWCLQPMHETWKYTHNNIFQLYNICLEHECRKICTNTNDNMPKYIFIATIW